MLPLGLKLQSALPSVGVAPRSLPQPPLLRLLEIAQNPRIEYPQRRNARNSAKFRVVFPSKIDRTRAAAQRGARSPEMATSSVSTVYIHVVDDVISKVRDEFVTCGVSEDVLSELQAIWEAKMMHCGAISGMIERPQLPRLTSGIAPFHDLNVPYEGTYEELRTPSLFPPTPAQTPFPGTAEQTPAQTPFPGTTEQQTPAHTPFPGSMDPSTYNIPTAPSDFNPIDDFRNGVVGTNAGAPSPYMQPPSPWMSQKPLGVDVNVAYVEGHDETERGIPHQSTQELLKVSSGKRKRDGYSSQLSSSGFLPQRDGSNDSILEELVQRKTSYCQNDLDKNAEANMLPQRDGVDDEYEDIFRYHGETPTPHVEPRVGTPSVSTPRLSKSEAVDEDEPPLNEDDDDDEDLDDYEREEVQQTQHLVLAQFDKVTRTKSRWKCTLKDGIMHLNGRDVLFNKATGEFDF